MRDASFEDADAEMERNEKQSKREIKTTLKTNISKRKVRALS